MLEAKLLRQSEYEKDEYIENAIKFGFRRTSLLPGETFFPKHNSIPACV